MFYQKNNKCSIHVMKNIKCTQLINTTIQSNNIERSKRKWHENNQEGNENPLRQMKEKKISKTISGKENCNQNGNKSTNYWVTIEAACKTRRCFRRRVNMPVVTGNYHGQNKDKNCEQWEFDLRSHFCYVELISLLKV